MDKLYPIPQRQIDLSGTDVLLRIQVINCLIIKVKGTSSFGSPFLFTPPGPLLGGTLSPTEISLLHSDHYSLFITSTPWPPLGGNYPY